MFAGMRSDQILSLQRTALFFIATLNSYMNCSSVALVELHLAEAISNNWPALRWIQSDVHS